MTNCCWFKHTFLTVSTVILASACFQPAQAQITASVLNGQFQVVGSPNALQTLRFVLHLPLRNITELDQLIADQTNPASPQYHQFLTPAQFRERFGSPPEYFALATTILRTLGFRVTRYTSQSIEVEGSIANVEQAFGALFATVRYRNGHLALKSLTPLKLPTSLTDLGVQLIDLSPTIRQHTHVIATAQPVPNNRNSLTGGYWFTDLKQAYEFPSYQTVNGAGRTVGIVISSDYQDDDINTYFAHEKMKPPTIIRRPVSGGAPFDPTSGASVEAELDIEQAGGMAPGSTIVVYNIPDLSDLSILSGYLAVIEDNQVDVVSSSFGGCEKLYTADYNNGLPRNDLLSIYNDIFRQGNAQGITFVASSGDNGGLGCVDLGYFSQNPTNPPSITGKFIPGAEFPASSPYVTAVGGTNLVTTYNVSSLDSQYVRQNAYGDKVQPYDPYGVGSLVSGGVVGSGGGESIFFSKPDYQQLVNTGTKNRAIPDVSLHMGGCPGIAVQPCGSERSGVIERFAGQYIRVLGTSASAPAFAGILALKAQVQGTRLGNENNDIYNLAAQNAQSPFQFYRQDIPGDNGLYKTQLGYNLVLGNGTPIVKNFVQLSDAPSAGTPQTPSNP